MSARPAASVLRRASAFRGFSSTATATPNSNGTPTPPTMSAKTYVRIAGPASYATRTDIHQFLNSHHVNPPSLHPTTSLPHYDLVQGSFDVFQNQSIWLLATPSESVARSIVHKISGRVAGLKLIRAAAIDQRLVDDMMGTSNRSRRNLRRRMNVIAPTEEERGRALLATNLPYGLAPRFLWGFFASYEVEAIRHLRKSGVACVVFKDENEACRALRERSNLPVQGNKQCLSLRMHQ